MRDVTRYPTPFNKCAVYLITVAGHRPTKIGIAIDPSRRRDRIQCGHWMDVILDEQFFVEDKTAAYAIEYKVHQLLKRKQIKGEWFNVRPYEASAAVRRVLQDTGYDLSQYQFLSEVCLLDAIDKETETCKGQSPH